jgi:hypothetical protein
MNTFVPSSLRSKRHVRAGIYAQAATRKGPKKFSQYIARHPVSLKKIFYVKENGTVIYRTKYNEYWGENIKAFSRVVIIYSSLDDLPVKLKKPVSL